MFIQQLLPLKHKTHLHLSTSASASSSSFPSPSTSAAVSSQSHLSSLSSLHQQLVNEHATCEQRLDTLNTELITGNNDVSYQLRKIQDEMKQQQLEQEQMAKKLDMSEKEVKQVVEQVGMGRVRRIAAEQQLSMTKRQQQEEQTYYAEQMRLAKAQITQLQHEMKASTLFTALEQTRQQQQQTAKERDTARAQIQQLQQQMENVICRICLVQVRDTLFLPCQHLLSCTTCAELVTSCPICNEKIDEKLTAYHP